MVRETAGSAIKAFSGHGWPKDTELTHLYKEVEKPGPAYYDSQVLTT